jgi:hypothetical protein
VAKKKLSETADQQERIEALKQEASRIANGKMRH